MLQKTIRALAEVPAMRNVAKMSQPGSREFLTFAAIRARWRLGGSTAGQSRFQREVQQRLGALPQFFTPSDAAPQLAEQLWMQAKAAYLDNPLPSLFKERLFVHLSRFCEVRYCVVRHAGYLLGKGYPAGDARAVPETIEQVIALLSRPVPHAAQLEAVFARLESYSKPAPIPAPRSKAEEDLFDAITVMFVVPARSAQARAAVRCAVGETAFEYLAALLAFIRTAHYWTETHPGLSYETDMIMQMAQRQDLARRLLDTADAEWAHVGDALREALTGQLQVLNTELQHRTRNLLSVIQVIFDRTRAKHTTLESFADVFSSRLDAISRVQTYLSRLVQGEKVTFDGLLRTELAAHAVSLQQITLEGPVGVRLRSSTLQTFALAIHELVVNAVKYGALAIPTAHLTVRWEVEHCEEQQPLLHVQWQETGVNTAVNDSAAVQAGYGRELIERALPYQLGAETHLVFAEDGVRCSIRVPLPAL
ncbi:sensor histidine kinase, partial [Dyella sp.]|uniref:sensor histidine kinase n=1 Tax=Dyella sp. TaxID=1869338 RepID=UPI002D76FFF8